MVPDSTIVQPCTELEATMHLIISAMDALLRVLLECGQQVVKDNRRFALSDVACEGSRLLGHGQNSMRIMLELTFETCDQMSPSLTKQRSASTIPKPWSWVSFVPYLPRQLAQCCLNG
jgi:hypothetical protein